MENMNTHRLRPGDVVEVRSAAEILATLDENGSLDAVPFMPEMLRYVGRRFTVSKRVEKICDLISPAGGSRRMRDTVFLADLRCDGSAHGGCQAACRIYWKEAWLRPVAAGRRARTEAATDSAATDGSATDGVHGEAESPAFRSLRSLAQSTVRPSSPPPDSAPGDEYYRCQATDALLATEPLRTAQPGQYVREITSGNVSIPRFLRVAVRAVWGSIGHRLGFKKPLPMTFGGDKRTRPEPLGLQPGDWVRVKSAEEIGKTLDANGTTRGLAFTAEMLASCGRTFRVKQRVDRIVDERTGKMLHFTNDCIILEGSVCTGDNVPGRWFCPRDGYPFWREAWLERVDPPEWAGRPAATDGRAEPAKQTVAPRS
jgi:hypothetical protein